MVWLAAASMLACLAQASGAQDLTLFAYDPARVTYECRAISDRPTYRGFEVRFPSQVPSEYPANQTVYAWLYEPKRPGPMPAVVVLHELATVQGGLARALCQQLAGVGIVALQVVMPYHMQRTPPGAASGELLVMGDLDHLRQTAVQAVVDVRCSVDFLASRPLVDPKRIGITGMSLGGTVALLASRIDGRFSAVASILGAGDPAFILWHSRLMGGAKVGLLEQGHGIADARRALESVNTIAYRDRNRKCAVLMIAGRHDWVMPVHAVKPTWKALGRPPIVWLNSGHISPLLARGRIFDEVRRFLQMQLGLRPGPYVPARLTTANLKVGVLGSQTLGVAPALVVEPIQITRDGTVAVDLGATPHGFLIGVSARPFEHLSLGLGTPIGRGRLRLEPYWMLHATF